MINAMRIKLDSLKDYDDFYKKIIAFKRLPETLIFDFHNPVEKEVEKILIFSKKIGMRNLIAIFNSDFFNYLYDSDNSVVIPLMNEIIFRIKNKKDINYIKKSNLSQKISFQIQLKKSLNYNKTIIKNAVTKGVRNIILDIQLKAVKEEKLRMLLKDVISFIRKKDLNIKGLDDIRLLSIKNNSILIGPKELQIETVNYCNFNCIFCWFHSPMLKKKYIPKYISFEKFKEIVNKAADMGTEIITLSGNGEPFMHPKIEEMLSYIAKKRLNLKIYTNGALITRKRAKLISDINDSFIHVNLPAATNETFRKIRSKALPISFPLVKNALIMLNALENKGNVRTEIGFIITKYNFHEIPSLFHLAKETGTKSICFKFVKAEPEIQKILLSKKETNLVIKMIKENMKKKEYMEINTNALDIINIAKDPSFKRHGFNMYYHSGNLKYKACYNGWFYTKICLSGHVSPCSINDMSLSRGDIKKRDFPGIYFSPQFKKLLIDGKKLLFDKDSLFKCKFCFRPKLNEKVHELIEY
jgi:MoaA/NifB/PqqE/SkfB family radical SAM enzyme